MESIVMAMPVLKEEENIWRISLMPEQEMSPVKLLASSPFMTVCNNSNYLVCSYNNVNVYSNIQGDITICIIL